MKKRYFRELSLTERAEIAKARIIEPNLSKAEFADKFNITLPTLTTIEGRLNFDKESAVWAMMEMILQKDQDLINLSTDIKYKWAESIQKWKIIKSKDIEVLDKIENTAMKRAALLKASSDATKENEPMKISINL